MIKTLLISTAFVFVFFGMNCNPPADFEVVGGQHLAFDGYSKHFEKLRITIESGVNKSSSKSLEKSFSVAHLLEKEAQFKVTEVVLEAKGKKFAGKLLSSVFDNKSKFEKGVGGIMRVAWQFDEAIETLFSEGFTITFKTLIDGKEETATLQFVPR